MTSTPIGRNPTAYNMNVGKTGDEKPADALQFRVQNKGSTTAELLRGKMSRLRSASTGHADTIQKPNFRQLIAPSAQALHVIGLLQQRA